MVESSELSERSQYKSQSYVTPLDTMVCAAGEVIQDQSRKDRWNPKYDD